MMRADVLASVGQKPKITSGDECCPDRRDRSLNRCRMFNCLGYLWMMGWKGVQHLRMKNQRVVVSDRIRGMKLIQITKFNYLVKLEIVSFFKKHFHFLRKCNRVFSRWRHNLISIRREVPSDILDNQQLLFTFEKYATQCVTFRSCAKTVRESALATVES